MQASIEASDEIPDQESFPVSVNWVQKMQFIGQDEKSHAIVIDTSPENGGKATGPTPGRLLLMAVASCKAIDVVDILEKSGPSTQASDRWAQVPELIPTAERLELEAQRPYLSFKESKCTSSRGKERLRNSPTLYSISESGLKKALALLYISFIL